MLEKCHMDKSVLAAVFYGGTLLQRPPRPGRPP